MNLPKTFTQTSDGLYDRHEYKLTLSNGQSEVYDSYESVQRRWFELPSQFLGYVEVLDKKTASKSKGFK